SWPLHAQRQKRGAVLSSLAKLKHGFTPLESSRGRSRVAGAPARRSARREGAAADWMIRTSTVDMTEKGSWLKVVEVVPARPCLRSPSFCCGDPFPTSANDVVRPAPTVQGARARHEDQTRDQQRVRKIRVGADRRTHEHRAGDLPGSKGRGHARHEASG